MQCYVLMGENVTNSDNVNGGVVQPQGGDGQLTQPVGTQDWQQANNEYSQNPGSFGNMPNPNAVPAKKNNKLIAGVVVVVAVVAVVLGLNFAGIIGGPKVKDYRTGQASVNTMTSSLSAMLTDYVSIATESADKISDKTTSQYEQDKKKFEQANDDFKNLKVMKDSNVKAAYEEYAPKARDFDAYMDDLIKALQAVTTINQACSREPRGSTVGNGFYKEYDEYFSQCLDKIESMDKISNKPVADFVASMQNYLNTQKDILKQMEALGDPDEMKTPEQVDKLNELVHKFNAVQAPTEDVKTLTQEVTKEVSKVDPTESLSKLKSLVDIGARSK